MSLLLRDQLIIGLAPDHLTVLRIGGRWRKKIRDRYEQALPPTDGNHWDEVIAALKILLEQPNWAACNLSIILSSHFVQYIVVPKGEGLTVKNQKDLAEHIFRDLFGELSREWDLRTSPSAMHATLACGVPISLLSALHDACEVRGFLRSVRPGLMPIFNGLRTKIKNGSGTLVLVEPGRIVWAVIKQGQWESVMSRAGEGSRLFDFLEEDDLLQGRRSGGPLWLCDFTGGFRLPVDSRWQLALLKPRHANFGGVPSLADWGYP